MLKHAPQVRCDLLLSQCVDKVESNDALGACVVHLCPWKNGNSATNDAIIADFERDWSFQRQLQYGTVLEHRGTGESEAFEQAAIFKFTSEVTGLTIEKSFVNT